jgi:elongation factor 1 alpha-like protein
VHITVRAPAENSTERQQTVGLETFGANKEMGRILLRRGGETVGAGIVLEILR